VTAPDDPPGGADPGPTTTGPTAGQTTGQTAGPRTTAGPTAGPTTADPATTGSTTADPTTTGPTTDNPTATGPTTGSTAGAAPGPTTGSLPTTVLPEGDGGRPGAGRHARTPRNAAYYARALGRRVRAQAALTAVLAVVAIAFVRIGLQHWREGTTELGLALLLAAALRASLADRAAGLLAVRPRRVDVLTYTLFGLVVIFVSLTITGGPLASR
jgi:hypothetical protein